MVLFYRKELTQKLAKVFASRLFDIVWLRLATKSGFIYIFFFMPQGHTTKKDFDPSFTILSAEVLRNLGIWKEFICFVTPMLGLEK